MLRQLLLFLSCVSQLAATDAKILICGCAQNIEGYLEYTIRNIETLAQHFTDYTIIIYENNSTDLTPYILQNWADTNPHVFLISEEIPKSQLATARTERIADARNNILKAAQQFPDFDYLIMADLDFSCDWPIAAILSTIDSETDWDCVSANGIDTHGCYVDKYALRSETYPLGPELLGFEWWQNCKNLHFTIPDNEWMPVYSAFGGLAIYKTSSLKECAYSGSTTPQLKEFYRRILTHMDRQHPHWIQYASRVKMNPQYPIPIIFTYNTSWEHASNHLLVTCCEHVGLHAAMHAKGKTKFYINPQLVMRY
jgi:glycosyltransferase involved in cell wall biosynthesis